MRTKKIIGFEKYLMETLSKDTESRTYFFNFFYEQPLTTQIALMRKFRGLSQIMLAHKSRLSQPEVARIEKSESNPRIKTLQKITQSLGVRPVLVPLELIPYLISKETTQEGKQYFNNIACGRRKIR